MVKVTNIEKDYRRTRLSGRQLEIAKTVLSILALGVVLSVAIVAPNAMQIFKLFLEENRQERFRKYKADSTYKVINRLAKRGWVQLSQKGEKTIVSITKEGKTEYLKFNLDKMTIKKPKRWDGLWRIVSFDIPEEHKIAREALRDLLKRLGFYRLQKSVFIHPYDCKKEIEFIKEVYEISLWVKYIVAKEIDDEEELKAKFNLSPESL